MFNLLIYYIKYYVLWFVFLILIFPFPLSFPLLRTRDYFFGCAYTSNIELSNASYGPKDILLGALNVSISVRDNCVK
jgi:hypothetical protein